MNMIVVAAIGIIGLLIGLARPKALAVLVLVIGLSVRTLVQTTGIDTLSLADDASVLLLAACVSLRYPLRPSAIGRRALIAALIFGGLGVTSGLLAGAPSAIIASGAYAALKGVVLAWSVGKIQWTEDDLRRFVNGAVWVALGLIATAVINLTSTAAWNQTFLGADVESIVRYGRVSLIGPFVHPYDMALLCSLLILIIVAGRRYLRTGPLLVAAVVVLAILLFLTNRRLGLIGLVIALPLAWSPSSRLPSRIGIGAGTVGLAAFVFWPLIAPAYNTVYEQYFKNPTQAARTVISLDAVDIANQEFPFGAGFGRFGSRAAADSYSPIYRERGYPKVFGLQPPEMVDGNSKYLTDTQLAPVLGESGWFGLAGFLALLYFVVPRPKNANGSAAVPIARSTAALALVVAAGSGVYVYPPGSTIVWFIFGTCSAVALNAQKLIESAASPAESTETRVGLAYESVEISK